MRTTPSVRVLLDVDGVLNVFGSEPRAWKKYRTTECGAWLKWAPKVARFITSLAAVEGVEVVWLTTWGSDAPRHLAPVLGLPAMPCAAEFPGWGVNDRLWQGGLCDWWKLPIVADLYEMDNVPFIWFDDDIPTSKQARRWLRSLPQGSALPLPPNPNEGITPPLVRAAVAFIEAKLGNVKISL